MPTFRKHPPDSNVTLQSPTWHIRAFDTPIYLAVFVAALLLVVLLARFGPSHRSPRTAQPGGFQDEKNSFGSEPRKDPSASYTQRYSAARFPRAWKPRQDWGNFGHGSRRPVGRADPIVGVERLWAAGQPRAMDDTEEDARQEHRTESASGVSRGVSTNPRHQQNPPLPGLRPELPPGRYSPPSSLLAASLSRHPGSSDGPGAPWSKGTGPMRGYSDWTRSTEQHSDGPKGSTVPHGTSLPGNAEGGGASGTWTTQLSRHPIPPPLTTSALSSSSIFTFQDRRPSYAVSIPPELDTSFIHQPNPDYFGASSPAQMFIRSPGSAESPKGMPIPTTTSASSNETMTTADTFSPSSYPPTSPLLPPPPPGQDFPYDYQFVGGPGGPGILLSEDEVQLHDDMLSVADGPCHAWKRHTRVYGGGVCLACAAADDEGGFYGDTVPMEDRR